MREGLDACSLDGLLLGVSYLSFIRRERLDDTQDEAAGAGAKSEGDP